MDHIQNDIRNRVNIREINRYLGYGAKTPDDSVGVMITEVLEELMCAVKPKNLYQLYDSRVAGNQVMLSASDKTILFESQNLADNLAQCEKVVLMAATLGLEADKLLQKYEILNMTKAQLRRRAVQRVLRRTVIFYRSRSVRHSQNTAGGCT